MTEDLLTQSAYHSESSSHLDGGAGLQKQGEANQVSAYCKELLMRGGREFSFEEMRAERFNQRQQQQLDEKLRLLKETMDHLSQELEDKKRLLQIRDSAEPPAASFLQIYDESQSAAARPAGETSHKDLLVESCTANVSQNPGSKTRDKLSPIQETSVGANSGLCSPLQEDQEEMEDQKVYEAQEVQEEMEVEEDQVPSSAVDPCDPDVRRRLLDQCDVTSSPDLRSESRPLPAVEERSCLQLGGDVIHIFSRVLEGPGFSVFKGATEDGYVVLKVDGSSVPWDFHQSLRLKKNSSTADSLPLISCFLFLDGCITVYTSPPGHMFTELTECVASDSVGYKVVGLLQLVSRLQSCRLLHAALRPHILTCSHRGFLIPDSVFPVDWSSSLDLDLRRDVTSVQQVPSAQTYISLGLLEPTAPPQLVDLVGLAETVHLLLTNSKMVPVKEGGVWRAEQFSGGEPCDVFSRMWRSFFCSLLNVGGRSSLSVLSELKDQLSTLYY
ncbi:mitotic checkpoint serine/threonine-protein kinase BUB1 beta isoform X2 [Cebidichthys violaceus]|uniref:mitotic checkpoint serine/threonine-protein kinase BUB1 beta isoform X2 n=1 Tax=Cebidichthys violaceus TaxID=271503 RepID=UPI0035CABCE6